ncbi:hypothetical protein [Actibacterium lipolyticum]|uniref:Uncharacterized protein n=1 Tax=Actibacterium lipolyticum TaxID=1524263 RepID=A0A238KLJ9_9RHOB|nr:hypothetical protein [Actibacterium lipolyticum]SMX43638.1 hypothetical protein COL8621_02352 [Actibacterium lipolyticum]
MIFVWLGRLLAWALIVFGTARVIIGFYVARNFVEPAAYNAATARYLGSSTSGEAIDKGLMYIAIGIAFGLLARIATQRSS